MKKIIIVLTTCSVISVLADPPAESGKRPPSKLSPEMQKYDKNHNGKLDQEKRAAFIKAIAKSHKK